MFLYPFSSTLSKRYYIKALIKFRSFVISESNMYKQYKQTSTPLSDENIILDKK